MKLRSYQTEALEVSKKRFDEGLSRQLIALPTGTGKTVLFAKVKEHHGLRDRGLVLVHRDELADQAKEKIELWNPHYKVGVEMGERSSSANDDVVVASVQTLGNSSSKRLAQFNPNQFDTVICDEAHHSVAASYKRIFEYFGLRDDRGRLGRGDRRLLLGVTATPNRGDGQGLGQVYDDIVYQMSILDAIKEGWLVDVLGVKVKTNVDLSSVNVRMGDFSVGELEAAVNVESRNHLIVQEWLRCASHRQTIAFCADVAHAQALAQTFKNYGVAAEAVWGGDPDRKDKIKFHKLGHIKVLTNCAVLTEGYDDWRISCIIMARPTKSQLLFSQMAGRGTRIPNDISNLHEARDLDKTIQKEDCLLMDVVDNTGRHSLVTLPSLFGLGEQTDLKGKSVVWAKQQVEAARAKHPLVDFSNLETIDQIDAFVEKVDLYTIKWEPEVTENSNLRWTKTISGDYLLTIPKDEQVVLFKDLLDKWSIAGSVLGNKIEAHGIETMPEAFKLANELITKNGQGVMSMLRRDAKWRKGTVSPLQKNLLTKLYKYDSAFVARIPEMTKGEASEWIDRKIRKNLKAEPKKVGV